MSDGLARFNQLPADEAGDLLVAAFAHPGWAAAVRAGRPYADITALIAAAQAAWDALPEAGWRAVFDSHPRIGEQGGHSPEASKREQSRASEASPETLTALAEQNRAYEARFGYVFLIAAAGLTGEEILAELRRRMANAPAAEFEEARRELRKISRVRLQMMLSR